MLAREIPDSAVVSADTTKSDRERILAEFKAGKIKVVANVGVLTTGFDYPELDTVVLCRLPCHSHCIIRWSDVSFVRAPARTAGS